MDRAPTRWIRTADQLDDLVDDLGGCRAVGLDTEADSLHHYTEKVCLIQLTAFGGASWLVDPLAFRDLSPLGQVLADESVLKVVHGGDNDVSSMRRDFGFTFRTMFDTSAPRSCWHWPSASDVSAVVLQTWQARRAPWGLPFPRQGGARFREG